MTFTDVTEYDNKLVATVVSDEHRNSQGPFDLMPRVEKIVSGAVAKAHKYYTIVDQNENYDLDYDEYTGDLYIQFKMNYFKKVPKDYNIWNEDYLLSSVFSWITSFLSRELSDCNLHKVYCVYTVFIDRE